jgi:NADP-dependent 3-hydroxy acid dehydrogenase YdfG
MMTFSGQVAVVTGAGSGIGRALALALGNAGAATLLVGREAARLNAVASELAGGGRAARTCPVDLATDAGIAELVASVAREGERVDILVHAAGDYAMGVVEEVPVESLDRLLRVNLLAPYALTRAMLPALRRAQGQVVFVNSTAALHPGAGVAAYAASKAGLRALADALRAEVNADGIRVLSIFPGRAATPMQEAIHRREGMPYRPETLLQPEDVAAAVLAALRLARTAEVTEIAIRPMRKPPT